ncbi:MAG: NADH-quinone oxidoreductase subunit N [Phycisphaerales bacterium]|nr:NADH-quinone oxidoreductase subunit N [Phycisphaerales bacterium]
MNEKLAILWPEIFLFIATCLVMITGQWPSRAIRHLTPWICAIALTVAFFAAMSSPTTQGMFPAIVPYAKMLIAGVGMLILLLLSGTVDRELEREVDNGKAFSSIRSNRGEFYAFFMFSITGLMLTASADDLIWLFLALELTSLPTYIMVAISTNEKKSLEAAVKYFFLGALGAATFLYGFALIYGSAGSTNLNEIAQVYATNGISSIGMIGLLIAVIGISFKIAAVPMHFYTPDVYQGAASPVAAMLAFVPKTAGFLALMFILGTAGWASNGNHLPVELEATLWIMAALTMTVGNILALLQSSVKRILAYSSIAHSGYMLVGLIAGPGEAGGPFYQNGIAAILFYLLTYGVMTVGVFAVLASLEHRNGTEADDINDIRGLCKSQPVLGWTLVICVLSMLGFPPLLGFLGKVGLFTSGIAAGQYALIVILGINSAIAACYYLRLVATAYIDDDSKTRPTIYPSPFFMRKIAGVISAFAVLFLLVFAQPLVNGAYKASEYVPAIAGEPEHEDHHAQDEIKDNDEHASNEVAIITND